MAQFRHKLNGTFLYALGQMVKRYGRFQVNGSERLQQAEASGKPLILSAWHGMTMMLVGLLTNRLDTDNIVLLMPNDWRGESLKIFATKMGATPFPMDLEDTASVGVARQLISLVQTVKQGKNCYITPDGPHGPAYVAKPGVAFIAQKARALILPLGAYTRHGYRLPRWDTYVTPYPFSRISVQVGEPIEVPPKVDLTAVTDKLTNILHRVTAQARANYYERQQ